MRYQVGFLVLILFSPLFLTSPAYGDARVRVATIPGGNTEAIVVSPSKKYVGVSRFSETGGSSNFVTINGPWYSVALPSMTVSKIPKLRRTTSAQGIFISMLAIGDDGTTCYLKIQDGARTVFIVSPTGRTFEILSAENEYTVPPFSQRHYRNSARESERNILPIHVLGR